MPFLDDMHGARPSRMRLLLAFLVLFLAYQLPEGLGLRVLHSFPVLAGLMLAFLPVAWLTGRWLGYRGLDAWYLAARPGWGRLLVLGLALATATKAAALAAGSAGCVYRIEWTAGLTGPALLASLLGALAETFFPSIAEDIVTRGFLMRALPGLARRHLFILGSALLFVLNHIYRYQDGPLELARLFCFGLPYAAALYYSRSLWAAVGLHWGWNFAGKYADQIAGIDLLRPALGPVVSMLAHLLLLALIVWAGERRHRRTAASLPV